MRSANLSAADLIGERSGGRRGGKGTLVSRRDAFTHSAVWACLNLRADLISTMPTDVFRRVGGIQIEQAKPPVLIAPGGKQMNWVEWCYATQVDLDSVGNTAGIITAIDGLGIPSVIELVDINAVTFLGTGGTLTAVRINGKEYAPEQIWHEKQYALSGSPIGLSPIAHAARSINGYLSAQEFADSWFSNSTVPGGHLKNTAKVLKKGEAAKVKENFKATVTSGDVWVSGNDWEYSMLSAKASESSFIDERKFSVTDVCRFLGVPADMIDAEGSSGSITYANVTQRNLQLLIMKINPALVRRETRISGLLHGDRFMKFNRGALLEMDLKSRYEAHKVGLDAEFLDITEVRNKENLPPLVIPTPVQVKSSADALGSLVRAGFDPSAAAAALGLPVIKHTGLVPITVAVPDSSMKSGQIPTEERAPVNVSVTLPPTERDDTSPVVNVYNQMPATATPDVTVTNVVEPTPVQVEVHNELTSVPSPITVEVTNDVAVPLVEVRNEVHPAEVVLAHPKVTKTTSEVSRDKSGEITGTTATTEVVED